MSNTPEAIKWWIRARGGVLDGEGGSGRRGTPVSSRSLSSGHWNGAFGCACVCEAKARLHRGRARLCCVGGFHHGRATAAEHRRRFLGLGVGLQPKLASVEGPGEDSGAHRGSGSKGGPAQRHRRRRPATVMGRRSRRGVLRGSSGTLSGTGRCAASLRNRSRGQGGPGITEDDELPRSRNSLSNESGRNSGEVGPGFRGKELGEFPGATVMFLRGFSGAPVRRRGVAAAVGAMLWAGQGSG